MCKRIVGSTAPQAAPARGDWLNLEEIATVEVTSEDARRPIDEALGPGGGWRAGEPGEQHIRLLFDKPQTLRCVRLRFQEKGGERTQEFRLRWSSDGGRVFHDIVRQQWNFSPSGATEEVEEYRVDLAGVTVLELSIIPDLRGGEARASLQELRLA